MSRRKHTQEPMIAADGALHDPLDPHPEEPTPLGLVLALNRSDREARVEALTEMTHESMTLTEELAASTGKTVVARCVLVSGGKDSFTIEHLFRGWADTIVHANTGTGIEATRQCVRDVAAARGLRMVEGHPKAGEGYRELVLGEVRTRAGDIIWPGGFPGPAAHGLMYQRLKERGLDDARHVLGIANSRTECAIWCAGRRRAESPLRADIPHREVDGSVVWGSPLALWHKADLVTYRLMHPDVARNPVAEVLGLSGECGCLSKATAGERERWFDAFPDDPFIDLIRELEALLAPRTDIPEHRKKWGWGGDLDERALRRKQIREDTATDGAAGRLCGPACSTRDPLLDLMDPLLALDTWGAA